MCRIYQSKLSERSVYRPTTGVIFVLSKVGNPMRILALALIVVLLGVSQAWAAVPTHQYRLDGTYTDDYGGPSLVATGGTLDSTKYTFGGNQGLSLTADLAKGSVYTIELQFKFDDVNGLRKIIEFKNLAMSASATSP